MNKDCRTKKGKLDMRNVKGAANKFMSKKKK